MNLGVLSQIEDIKKMQNEGQKQSGNSIVKSSLNEEIISEHEAVILNEIYK